MRDMSLEELAEAVATERPEAYVLGEQAYLALARQGVQLPTGPKDGPALFVLEDVGGDAIVFYDGEAFRRYVCLRMKLGHRGAMDELESDEAPGIKSLTYEVA